MIDAWRAQRILDRITPSTFSTLQWFTGRTSLRYGDPVPPGTTLDIGAWAIHLTPGYTLTAASNDDGTCLDQHDQAADIDATAAALFGITETDMEQLSRVTDDAIAVEMLRQLAAGRRPNIDGARSAVHHRVGAR